MPNAKCWLLTNVTAVWGKVVGALLINLLLLHSILLHLSKQLLLLAQRILPLHSNYTAAFTSDTTALFEEETHANLSPRSDPTLGLYANWRIGK